MKSEFNIDTLKIKEFTLDKIVKHAAILMIGKRGTGKSFLVRAICDYYKDKAPFLVICPTEKLNGDYIKFIPGAYIYEHFQGEIIEKVMYRQQVLLEKKKKYENEGKNINARVFIIMDDCLSSKGTWMRDPTVYDLLFNGRHYHITYILTMQYVLGISPELRGNFDYIFLLADDVVDNIRKLHKYYAGMFPNFKSFQDTFNELTKERGCMVIVNTGVRNDITDKIFRFKAKAPEKEFTVGFRQYVKYSEKNYNKNWVKDQNTNKSFNIEAYYSKPKSDRGQMKIEVINKEDEENKN